MAIEARVWISFDLGLRGEYTQLYAWLDGYGAKECGENVATFRTEKTGKQLADELAKLLDPSRNPRVYIIEREHGGRFYLGKRIAAPWTGYAETSIDSGVES